MASERNGEIMREAGRPRFEAIAAAFAAGPADWASAPVERSPVGGAAKRCLDILVALAALIVAAPMMALVAMLVKASDGGPALFAQRRVGFDGRPFRCWKFRSMTTDAEARLAEHLARDAAAALEWERARKLVHDPRVTALGRVLRRSSLDELPQLINVLIGDMSCVGPRPVAPQELSKYGRAAPDYLRARPGLTGLWQVSGRSRRTYEERVALDCDYVRRCSLTLDLVILARTLPALLDVDATS